MARKDNKSADELRGENRILRRLRATEGVAGVLITFFKWGAVAFVFYQLKETAVGLAGKLTMADIGIKVAGNLAISQALAWALGVGSAGYGIVQNKLRKDVVQRLQGRIQQLERQRDARRTSSNLTPRGDTRAEDET
jgi:hypothetical protein